MHVSFLIQIGFHKAVMLLSAFIDQTIDSSKNLSGIGLVFLVSVWKKIPFLWFIQQILLMQPC